MAPQRESIHEDTHFDLESILDEKNELDNIKNRSRFIKLYISLILLSNFLVLISSQEISIDNTFLLAGITNFMIPSIGILYYYSGGGTNQDFIRASSTWSDGGLLMNTALVEYENARPKITNEPKFKVFSISATVYLFTIPMIIGAFLIIFGFFVL